MKIFRHLGVIIAVFWCAAMAMAPMAAAAGAGQGSNQGFDQARNSYFQAGPGNNPGQQGQGGSGNNQQSQNNFGPGQGNGPQGKGNTTEFGNRTMFRPDDGNMTAPPDMPDGAPMNKTAMNGTAMHGHRGNMTGGNIADFRNMTPPGDLDPSNMTAFNQTGRGHGDGNLTMPAPPQQGNGGNGGPQGNQDRQGNSQDDSGDSLISELISWLKAHGVS